MQERCASSLCHEEAWLLFMPQSFIAKNQKKHAYVSMGGCAPAHRLHPPRHNTAIRPTPSTATTRFTTTPQR